MGEVAQLVTRLTVDAKEFNRGIEEAQAKASTFAETTGSKISAMGVGIGLAVSSGLAVALHSLDEGIEKIESLYQSSRKLGLSIGDLQRLQFAAKESGVEADSLNTMMGFMNKTIGEAELGNTKAIGTFSALGLSMKDLKGNSSADNFIKISQALKGFEGSDVQNALAKGVVGRGARDGIALFNSDIKEAVDHAKELGIGLSTLQGENVHQLALHMHELVAEMQNSSLKFLGDMAPALDTLLTKIESVFSSISSHIADAALALTSARGEADDGSWTTWLTKDMYAAQQKVGLMVSDVISDVTDDIKSGVQSLQHIGILPDDGMAGFGYNKGASVPNKAPEISTQSEKTAANIKKLGDASLEVSDKLSTIGSTIKGDEQAAIAANVKRILGDQMGEGLKASVGNDTTLSGLDQQAWEDKLKNIYDSIAKYGDSIEVESQLANAKMLAGSNKIDVGTVNDLQKYAKEVGGNTEQSLTINIKAEQGLLVKAADLSAKIKIGVQQLTSGEAATLA